MHVSSCGMNELTVSATKTGTHNRPLDRRARKEGFGCGLVATIDTAAFEGDPTFLGQVTKDSCGVLPRGAAGLDCVLSLEGFADGNAGNVLADVIGGIFLFLRWRSHQSFVGHQIIVRFTFAVAGKDDKVTFVVFNVFGMDGFDIQDRRAECAPSDGAEDALAGLQIPFSILHFWRVSSADDCDIVLLAKDGEMGEERLYSPVVVVFHVRGKDVERVDHQQSSVRVGFLDVVDEGIGGGEMFEFRRQQRHPADASGINADTFESVNGFFRRSIAGDVHPRRRSGSVAVNGQTFFPHWKMLKEVGGFARTGGTGEDMNATNGKDFFDDPLLRQERLPKVEHWAAPLGGKLPVAPIP